jgi:hypothetical protein
MPRFYSDTSREGDKWSLPDAEVFELTPQEQIESGLWEDELWELMRSDNQHRLATMNSRSRERLLDELIELHGIATAWFYRFGFPGCMPESDLFGPFASQEDAIADCRESVDW